MNVVAVELGERPPVMSPARMFAPQGARIMAETLGHFTFADDAIVVLDWSNETLRQPPEAHKPVVFIVTSKMVDGKRLDVEVRLDVEDTFGRDTISGEDFVTIIKSMEDKMLYEIERYKNA